MYTKYLQIIQTIESQDAPFSKLPRPQQTLVWTLTGSVVGLLSSLSTAQDEIVEAISKISTIPNFLFGLLSFEPTPNEVQNEVLSCLATLLEDNRPLAEVVVENGDWLKRLMQIKDSGAPTNVSACSVLHNIFTTMQWSDHKTPIEGASDAALISTLVHTLETASPSSNGTNGDASHSSPDQVLQLALEIIASISTSLQEALEHGHEHDYKNEEKFEGFDDEPVDVDEMDAEGDDVGDEDKEEEEGDAEDSEMNMDEIEADMELVTGDASEDDNTASEELTLERLIRTATPAILPLARPSPTHINSTIQSSALSALNNIAWTISSIDFSTGHLNSIKKTWSTLSQQTWREIISPVLASNTADIDLASSITSLGWAVSRSVGGEITLQLDEQRKFMALYQASKNLNPPPEMNGSAKKSEDETDAFQSLGVKSIGVLGSLALSPCPIPLNREIGIFLLTTLSSLPSIPAADAVEALNAIMDIYSDKSYEFDEEVFWGDGYYKHLEEVLPRVRKLAKGVDKRRFGELRARVDEVVLNLVRFLKYKKTERGQKD